MNEVLGTFSPKSSLCLCRHKVERLNLKQMSYGIWFSMHLIDYTHSNVFFMNSIFSMMFKSLKQQ